VLFNEGNRAEPTGPDEREGDIPLAADQAPPLSSDASAHGEAGPILHRQLGDVHAEVLALQSARSMTDAPPPWFACI
jgi:hypothetical protein